MQQRVSDARKKGWTTAENIPLIGGATICVYLPITAQGRAVVLGMGGTIERIAPKRAEYLALMQNLAAQLSNRIEPGKRNTGDTRK
jgi:DNA-binding IclR family transcriptional regulator